MEDKENGFGGTSYQHEIQDWTTNLAQQFIRDTFLKWDSRKGRLLYLRFILNASVEDLTEDFDYSSVNAARVTISNARKGFLDWIYQLPETEKRFREALKYIELNQNWGDSEENIE